MSSWLGIPILGIPTFFVEVPLVVRALSVIVATLAVTTTLTTTESAMIVVVTVVGILRMLEGAVWTGHSTVTELSEDWAHAVVVVRFALDGHPCLSR